MTTVQMEELAVGCFQLVLAIGLLWLGGRQLRSWRALEASWQRLAEAWGRLGERAGRAAADADNVVP